MLMNVYIMRRYIQDDFGFIKWLNKVDFNILGLSSEWSIQ